MFRIGGERAFYAPWPRLRALSPPPQAYFEAINWHRTALHELRSCDGASFCASTATSPARSARRNMRSRSWSRRCTAAFCCASLGIVPTVRHADYIGSWLEVLREDNRAIVRAASQASKAAVPVQLLARYDQLACPLDTGEREAA